MPWIQIIRILMCRSEENLCVWWEAPKIMLSLSVVFSKMIEEYGHSFRIFVRTLLHVCFAPLVLFSLSPFASSRSFFNFISAYSHCVSLLNRHFGHLPHQNFQFTIEVGFNLYCNFISTFSHIYVVFVVRSMVAINVIHMCIRLLLSIHRILSDWILVHSETM